jgi:hypothetical protein
MKPHISNPGFEGRLDQFLDEQRLAVGALGDFSTISGGSAFPASLVMDRRVLSINPAYFDLTGGLERRLYARRRLAAAPVLIHPFGIPPLRVA